MDYCETTRARVGAAAIRILNKYGEKIAIEFYRGGFAAMTMCLVTMKGRDWTRDYFDHLLGTIRPPRTRPTLVINNGDFGLSA